MDSIRPNISFSGSASRTGGVATWMGLIGGLVWGLDVSDIVLVTIEDGGGYVSMYRHFMPGSPAYDNLPRVLGLDVIR